LPVQDDTFKPKGGKKRYNTWHLNKLLLLLLLLLLLFVKHVDDYVKTKGRTTCLIIHEKEIGCLAQLVLGLTGTRQ
jgi:hypothetical protein